MWPTWIARIKGCLVFSWLVHVNISFCKGASHLDFCTPRGSNTITFAVLKAVTGCKNRHGWWQFHEYAAPLPVGIEIPKFAYGWGPRQQSPISSLMSIGTGVFDPWGLDVRVFHCQSESPLQQFYATYDIVHSFGQSGYWQVIERCDVLVITASPPRASVH